MQTLLAVLQLIPAIIKAMQAAEEFVPIPGAGKAKLNFVLSVVTDIYEGAKSLVPQITTVVAHLVTLANATGIFGKSTPAA